MRDKALRSNCNDGVEARDGSEVNTVEGHLNHSPENDRYHRNLMLLLDLADDTGEREASIACEGIKCTSTLGEESVCACDINDHD